MMSRLDATDVEKRSREKSDAVVLKHINEYTFNSLLVLQLFPLWIGLRIGSGRVTYGFRGLGQVLKFGPACNSALK